MQRAAMTGVPSLFEFDFSAPAPVAPLRVGDIARQLLPFVGKFQTVYPYWQVIAEHPASTPARRLLSCRAVPVSEYMGERHVFKADQLQATGLSWRVPSETEIDGWMQREWHTTQYAASLDLKEDGTVFDFEGRWRARGAVGHITGRRGDGGIYIKYPPLSAEAELLALMAHLPYQCGRHARRTYEVPA